MALTASTAALANTYPDKPVRLVVPFGPGSTTDMFARLLASELSTELGQSIVVENRAGASGNIGSEYVANASPDGYTLLFGAASTNATNASLFPDLRFNPQTAFEPIALVASVPLVLVVNPDVPVKSVAELVSLVKKTPQSYASGGSGGTTHLAAELFRSQIGAELHHIPYKGTAAALPDVISGRIPMMFDTVAVSLPHIESGKLRPLAVTSSQRVGLLKDVPTMQEAGQKDFEAVAWFGLFAPAGTPAPIVQKLNAGAVKVLNSDKVKAQFEKMGGITGNTTVAEFDAYVKAEHEKWKRVIKETGAQAG
ncbi:tripartite tricarboxylate transporter substrate binding protein [Bordetella sp. 15P40C-2]|nr:tripartite tricarboxylate transporter substrate binding protein [Bordetella sp. 15P40C-2]